MDIKKAISTDTVFQDLKSTTKTGVIEEILDRMIAAGKIRAENRAEVLNAILVRENKMSTGMQHGIAIPHAKTDAVEDLVAALAIKKEGIDFDALDGKPSRIFILTVSPAKRTGPHIQFLAEISRKLNQPAIQEKLLLAQTKEDILQLL